MLSKGARFASVTIPLQIRLVLFGAVMEASDISQCGRCMCGAVTFRVSAEPYFTAICSCTFCQKLTGSDYNVEAMFRPHQIEITNGATTTFADVSGGSGLLVRVHFCQRCGTSMSLRPCRFPDCVSIFSGAFDNLSWFRRDPDAAIAYFFRDKAATGLVTPEGCKPYSGHGVALDGSPNEPVVPTEMIVVK